MDTNKETYQTPSVLIFEVKTEGVICGTVTIDPGLTVEYMRWEMYIHPTTS